MPTRTARSRLRRSERFGISALPRRCRWCLKAVCSRLNSRKHGAMPGPCAGVSLAAIRHSLLHSGAVVDGVLDVCDLMDPLVRGPRPRRRPLCEPVMRASSPKACPHFHRHRPNQSDEAVAYRSCAVDASYGVVSDEPIDVAVLIGKITSEPETPLAANDNHVVIDLTDPFGLPGCRPVRQGSSSFGNPQSGRECSQALATSGKVRCCVGVSEGSGCGRDP